MTIDIVYFNEGEDLDKWLPALSQAIPQARIRAWQPQDTTPVDYAFLWHPPLEMLQTIRVKKGLVNLAAGVDGLLADLPEHLQHLPIYRLEDAGMAMQMVEYVSHAVLRYFRRFDVYEAQCRAGVWQELTPYRKQDFTIGVMGVGVMGGAVLAHLKSLGFPVRGWGQHEKSNQSYPYFYGQSQLNDFLSGLRVLVCLLPLTTQTQAILNLSVFSKMQPQSYLINVGRGKQLVDADLLQAIAVGQIAGATLDVTSVEPLPKNHSFWNDKAITITPHIAALTDCDETVAQVARLIEALERGEKVSAQVDKARGY